MYKYIKAQSVDRKKMQQRLESMSDTILEHLAKLVLYSPVRQNDVNGWVNNCGSKLLRAYNTEAKSSLSSEFYEHTLFGSFPISERDSQGILGDCADNFTLIGYPEITEEQLIVLAKTFYNVCSQLMDTVIPLLTSKRENKDRQFFHNIVRKCLMDNKVLDENGNPMSPEYESTNEHETKNEEYK